MVLFATFQKKNYICTCKKKNYWGALFIFYEADVKSWRRPKSQNEKIWKQELICVTFGAGWFRRTVDGEWIRSILRPGFGVFWIPLRGARISRRLLSNLVSHELDFKQNCLFLAIVTPGTLVT